MHVESMKPSRAVNLSQGDADAVWNWVLHRQGLARGEKQSSVVGVAQRALGLHAARLPSPYSTALARTKDSDVALRLLRGNHRSELVTVRCMRKTLHVLPLDLAAVAHAATLHFRERDARRAAVNANLDAATLSKATSAITKKLERDGTLAYREIERQLAGRSLNTTAVRVALKLGWELGLFSYRNAADGWNKERRTFGLTRREHPGLDMGVDRERATADLMVSYFDRYGPASLRDAMWWSGLSRSAVITGLRRGGRPMVTLMVPWCDSPLYMFEDQFDVVDMSQPAGESPVDFLAHEDVALKAYFESRERYLGTLAPRFAFNQIGEVLPTVVQNGKVVGRWSWDVPRQSVVFSIERGMRSRALTTAAKLQATRVTLALREGLARPS